MRWLFKTSSDVDIRLFLSCSSQDKASVYTSFDGFRVSSVLNKDVKQFGKKFILDGKEDTCWNSDKGNPQWVILKLVENEKVNGFSIQFQGGFAGQQCFLELKEDDTIHKEPFYPEDINSVQVFNLSRPYVTGELRFLFEKSTDFFGRIVIYSIDVSVS